MRTQQFIDGAIHLIVLFTIGTLSLLGACVPENTEETWTRPHIDAMVEYPDYAPELISIRVGPTTALLPNFDANVLSYQTTTSADTTTATIAALGLDPEATITVNGSTIIDGFSLPIPLEAGENLVEVQVTTVRGAQRTYDIQVFRGDKIVEQIAYVKGSSTEFLGKFGDSIAISGDTMVVGAWIAGNDAYVFRRYGGIWSQEAHLRPSTLDSTGDNFGYSVAISGDTIAIGAPHEASDSVGVYGAEGNNNAEKSGAAYVFHRTNRTWLQQAYIKASNTDAEDQFGKSVAIDGHTLVVGAPRESSGSTSINGDQENNTVRYSGAVYAFQRRAQTWSQEAYIKASNADTGAHFGGSVALSGDILAVAAASGSGAAYVFERNAGAWSEAAYLQASNTGASDLFGSSIALSGTTLVVGARLEDSEATGVNGLENNEGAEGSGAAYVFQRTNGVWLQQAYLKASNTGAGDAFGDSIAIFGDRLAIGSTGEDSPANGVASGPGLQLANSAKNSGAVYLFRRSSEGWSQEAYLKASNTGIDDNFGASVALSVDTLAVGASDESSSATGVNPPTSQQADNSVLGGGATYLFE